MELTITKVGSLRIMAWTLRWYPEGDDYLVPLQGGQGVQDGSKDQELKQSFIR